MASSFARFQPIRKLMKYAVELHDISKHFGANHVLRGVSLNFEPGKFYVLLGKNGAGKSTLMRILMRYEQAEKGRGEIFGVPLESDAETFNQEIGYVSESLDFALPLRMNRLFAFFSELYPRWDQKLFERVLGELHIDLNKYFKELSRGQKMQVAFAAALAIRPRLLLLDEITAVLDANARAYFMEYLGRFTREGGTVVMATNIVSEVQNFANHMILLSDGKVILDLPVTELSRRFMKVRRCAGEEHALAITLFSDSRCIEVGLNADGSTSYIMAAALAAEKGLGAKDLAVMLDHRTITAEEIFIYFTRSKAAEETGAVAA